MRPARRRSPPPRLRHGGGQPDSHEEPREGLRKVLAVRGEELGTGNVPRREQRLQDRPRKREDLMEIDDPVLDLDPTVALGVQEVEVPESPLADLIAVPAPGFGRRIPALASLVLLPVVLELVEAIVRTDH